MEWQVKKSEKTVIVEQPLLPDTFTFCGFVFLTTSRPAKSLCTFQGDVAVNS